MTTHFSNGVTNVRGKDGATSLFSGIKQPLITGGYINKNKRIKTTGNFTMMKIGQSHQLVDLTFN